MRQNDHFTVLSLELHLFFSRIMKEHSLFLVAAFTPANAALAKQAEHFMREFEQLLFRATVLGDGVISREALAAEEIFTPFTARAERQTECFTGIPINGDITARQVRLRWRSCSGTNPRLRGQVQALNRTALELLNGLIALKEQILCEVLNGQIFTMNYPLLLEHIIREAKLYREYVCRLEQEGDLDCRSMAELEQFWNQIMMEHALFIRGLLDPAEEELIKTAHGFAEDFCCLLERSRCAHDQTLTRETREKVCALRDFKAAGTRGIEEARIRSVILPLLADHVLREANHYLRLLS